MSGVGMYVMIFLSQEGQLRLRLAAERNGKLSTAEQEALAIGITATTADTPELQAALLGRIAALIPVRDAHGRAREASALVDDLKKGAWLS